MNEGYPTKYQRISRCRQSLLKERTQKISKAVSLLLDNSVQQFVERAEEIDQQQPIQEVELPEKGVRVSAKVSPLEHNFRQR